MPADEQEKVPGEGEGVHGRLRGRILDDVRRGGHEAEAASVRGMSTLGGAAKALQLEIVETPLAGARALVGHVLGLRLLVPAEGIHGPRETPVLVYVFRDAIAIRPSDDAPMSAVPMYGLHIVLPHVALAHWAYKAGRTAHANLDLERKDRDYEPALDTWTVDDFREADEKLDVVMFADLAGPVHVYPHLGMARMAYTPAGGTVVRLKSALPASTTECVRLGEMMGRALPSGMLSLERPSTEHDTDGEADATAGADSGATAPGREGLGGSSERQV